jgi:hypothetical protein
MTRNESVPGAPATSATFPKAKIAGFGSTFMRAGSTKATTSRKWTA